MDDFDKAGRKFIGIGGIKCPCCSTYRGRGKSRNSNYSKARRSVIKQRDRREFDMEIIKRRCEDDRGADIKGCED